MLSQVMAGEMGFPGGASGSTHLPIRTKRHRFELRARKIPWERAHLLQYSCLKPRQRSAVGYSPRSQDWDKLKQFIIQRVGRRPINIFYLDFEDSHCED